MKSYAPNNIKYRMANKLKEYANWDKILQDSAIDSLLTTTSEAISEVSRYLEYNVRERTWDTAQNISSIVEQSRFFGYKPRRKVSSVGTITISHNSKLLDITSASELTDFTTYSASNISLPPSLPLLINDLPFITTLGDTYASGLKYLDIPIMQGSIKNISTTFQKTTGIPFEKLRIQNPNIEAAFDETSAQYFYVRATLPDGSSVDCYEYDSIFLADSETYAYEVYSSLEDNPEDDYIELMFGNNNSGAVLPTGSILNVYFIETEGANGNISEKFIAKGSFLYGGNTFYYNNLYNILGGRDRDTIETIKSNAPVYYLSQGSIVTENQYKSAIELISNVYKAVVYPDFIDRKIKYSAITSLGEPLNSIELQEAVIQRLEGKIPPLDVLEYEEPDILGIKINYLGNIDTSKNLDPTQIETDISDLLMENFNIFNFDFEKHLNISSINTVVVTDVSLIRQDWFIEAKETVLASSFEIDDSFQNYTSTFEFNHSFLEIPKSDFRYLERIDIIWSCDGCASKNKSLFLIYNPEHETDPMIPYFIVKQFPYIDRIITQDYWENSMLNSNVAPEEIVSGDDDYYPISFEFNEVSPYNETKIIILASYLGEKYIDFSGYSPEELDADVRIEARAFPLYTTTGEITPLNKNSIILIQDSDINVEVS